MNIEYFRILPSPNGREGMRIYGQPSNPRVIDTLRLAVELGRVSRHELEPGLPERDLAPAISPRYFRVTMGAYGTGELTTGAKNDPDRNQGYATSYLRVDTPGRWVSLLHSFDVYGLPGGLLYGAVVVMPPSFELEFLAQLPSQPLAEM